MIINSVNVKRKKSQTPIWKEKDLYTRINLAKLCIQVSYLLSIWLGVYE